MKWIISLIIVLFFGNVVLFGQQSLNATIDTKGTVTLDERPLGSSYEVDFSNLPFADSKTAESYFKAINTEGITVQVDNEKKIAKILLSIEKRPTWSKEIWRAFLQRQVKPIPH